MGNAERSSARRETENDDELRHTNSERIQNCDQCQGCGFFLSLFGRLDGIFLQTRRIPDWLLIGVRLNIKPNTSIQLRAKRDACTDFALLEETIETQTLNYVTARNDAMKLFRHRMAAGYSVGREFS